MSQPNVLLFAGGDTEPAKVPLTAALEWLRNHPEGLGRSPFFFGDSEADPPTVIASVDAAELPVSGPFVIAHAVRRASDLLLDGIVIEGMTLGLEVDGRRFPELPGRDELVRLLAGEKTFVVIDERPYRPNTEVFAFPQVYEETVRSIDALKALGIPQAAMMLLATTEEITVELHPALFTAHHGPGLPGIYRALLASITGLRIERGTVTKTADRTVVPGVFAMGTPQLLPGAIHPTSKRVKVQVGPSHFAYGPAAFSDYCSKKREPTECQKELRAYLKFLAPPASPFVCPKLDELVAGLQPVAAPAAAEQGPATDKLARGGFRPLAEDLTDCLHDFPLAVPLLKSPIAELNRLLCGGFTHGGLHLLVGGREEGKATLLLHHAIAWAADHAVLLLSTEMSLMEIAQRLAAIQHRTPYADLVQRHLAAEGPEGEKGRRSLEQALRAVAGKLGDHLFFRGADSGIDATDPDQVVELIRMMPANRPRVLLVDGWRPAGMAGPVNSAAAPATGTDDGPRGDPPTDAALAALHARVRGQVAAVVATVHLPPRGLANPHRIEADDLKILDQYQHVSDTILHASTDRAHHQRAVAITSGKPDPTVVQALENRLFQGSARLRNDTWLIVRLLHRRYGPRGGLLLLFQRDLGRLAPAMPLPLGR